MRPKRVSPQQVAEDCIKRGDSREHLFEVKFINDLKGESIHTQYITATNIS